MRGLARLSEREPVLKLKYSVIGILCSMLFCTILWGLHESYMSQDTTEEFLVESPLETQASNQVDTFTATHILEHAPITRIDIGEDMGILDWSTGKLVFTGKLDESAKIFLEFLKPFVEEYIEAEVERRMEANRENR